MDARPIDRSQSAWERPPAGWTAATAMAAIALAAFAYAAIRAATLSLTHDEALSYQIIRGAIETLRPGFFASANTHPLNSLAMIVADQISGPYELGLRWASLLGHALYLGATAAFLLRLRASWIALAGFALANLNPFLLDFFSLARGYSMTVGLTAAGLALYAIDAERRGWSDAEGRRGWRSRRVLAIALLALAALSNFSAVYVFLATLATAGFTVAMATARRIGAKPVSVLFAPFWDAEFRRLLVVFILFLLAFLPFFAVIGLLKQDFFYGGVRNFYDDTLLSLSRTYFYGAETAERRAVFVGGALLAAAIVVMAAVLRARRGFFGQETAATLLIVLLGVHANFYLLGTNFPVERAALFLWPLITMALAASADALLSRAPSPARLLGAGVGVALMAGVAVNLASALNADRTFTWANDSATREMIGDVAELERTRPLESLHVNWLFLAPVAHYADLAPSLAEVEIGRTEHYWCAGIKRLEPDYPFYRPDFSLCETAPRLTIDADLNSAALFLDDSIAERMLSDAPQAELVRRYPSAGASLYYLP